MLKVPCGYFQRLPQSPLELELGAQHSAVAARLLAKSGPLVGRRRSAV